MKATWKDYPGKSDLTLVFGHISAEVIELGPAPASGTGPRVPNPGDSEWGILTHPFVPETLIGTRDDAKARAETILRDMLAAATQALG
jgi:hypothetical protein